jgi:hypothetical protein
MPLVVRRPRGRGVAPSLRAAGEVFHDDPMGGACGTWSG